MPAATSSATAPSSNTYNPAGRLVRAQGVTLTLVYTYNGDGLRVAQSAGGTLTTYAWDWAAAVPELLSDGNALYLVGHETLGQQDGGEWAYYLPDALGSIRQAANAAGAVVRVREWDPYGVEVGSALAGPGYTGEWWDGAVGLLYLRARWYAPGVGRFTQRDFWEGTLWHPLSLHPYGYVTGNPINYTDPSGLIAEEEASVADRIAQDLYARYLLQIERDWGWKILPVPAPMPPLPGVDPELSKTACAEWQPGYWTLTELLLMWATAERMGAAMGGAERFRDLVGFVRIKKTPFTCGRGCTSLGRIELLDQGRPPAPGTPMRDLIIKDWVNFDAWTIAHETGYAWDARWGWRLSRGLERFTGGRTDLWGGVDLLPSGQCDPPLYRLPGCNRAGYFYGGIPPKGSDINFNRVEDFAESWAAYVFPDEAQQQVAQYGQERIRKEYRRLLYYEDYRETARWAYINGLITGDIAP